MKSIARTIKRTVLTSSMAALLSMAAGAGGDHVPVKGNDSVSGSGSAPFRTISLCGKRSIRRRRYYRSCRSLQGMD
ncbi:MAG: hypothetical protein LBH04_10090 [Tannerellaceae bacterium]|nr:hypothetical protein [Tannerellaceae bacterium]